MYKAIIFDRDGVLLDSEHTNVRAGELAFKELGIALTEQEAKSIVGHHVDDYAGPILQKHSLDYDTFRAIQRKHYYELLESTPVFEKTIQLLHNIHNKGIRLALCTSSGKEGTLTLLKGLGIKDLFEQIVTKEDYSNRKPNPEPYLVTAKKLGVDPQDCLVVEDSEVGLQAALAAGMKCIVIFNEYTKGHNFNGAQQVVDSADKLKLSEIIG